MGTLFASTLRALVREKSLFIWSLAFPVLMATIFMFMFANLDGAMEFDPVPTGVVADEAWDASPFSAVAEALGERGDDQLLDVRRFADGEAAASALVDGEVMGVFSVDEDGEPVLSLAPGLQIGQTTDMDAIDRSILESVVGTYVRDADLMTSVARENPGAFADPGRLEAMFSSVDATEEVSLTHAAPKESVRFYYALFAMAALFGAQIAVVAVCWTQPNLSPLGARRALGAIGRTRTLLATLLACWLLSFCCLLIAFLYTRLVVGVDFAGREGLCVAGLGAASLLACALGTALGSLPKLDVGSKTGILTGVVCLLSLFTGLYGEPCMELADMVSREFPVLASLNPAKAICDMFYSLYYYDGLEVFAGNVALIGLFSAALFAVGALFVRRQRYASLWICLGSGGEASHLSAGVRGLFEPHGPVYHQRRVPAGDKCGL